MNRWRWLAVVGGLIYCGVVSWPLQAAELCVSAPADRPGAIPQPMAEWDVMTSPVVEFQASLGEERQWNVAIPKASTFTLRTERLDQQEGRLEYVIKVEKIGQGRARRSLTAVDRSYTGDTYTYLAFEPGWYVVLVRVQREFGDSWSGKDPIRPQLRLSFGSYEPLPTPIPALTQGAVFVITANASENVRVLPFRMTQRASVRMRFASVCSPDLLTTRPPRYSAQALEECQRLGIEPDPSAGSNIPPFMVDVLDSQGRELSSLWDEFSLPQTEEVVKGAAELPLQIEVSRAANELRLRHEELTGFLPEGQYALRVRRLLSWSLWDSFRAESPSASFVRRSLPTIYESLGEDRPSSRLHMTATVAEFKPEPLPPATQALATWLDAIGLSEDFFVVDFYTANPAGATSCAARRDRYYQSMLFKVVESRRTGEGNKGKKDIKYVRNPCNPNGEGLFLLGNYPFDIGIQPVWVARQDVPTILVHLDNRLNGPLPESLDDLLWDRMLLKISSGLRLSQRQIVILVSQPEPGPYRAGRPRGSFPIAWRKDGMLRWMNRGGSMPSQGASMLLDNPPNPNPPNPRTDHAAAESHFATGMPKIGRRIAAFLETSYTAKGATVEFLERSDDFVEAIIRKLRGEVIPGGRDWERVQVSVFALQREKNVIQLRTSVDARIASGLGNYPPDSSFTTDMEPRYSGALTEYARRLLDRIQAEFTKKGPKQ